MGLLLISRDLAVVADMSDRDHHAAWRVMEAGEPPARSPNRRTPTHGSSRLPRCTCRTGEVPHRNKTHPSLPALLSFREVVRDYPNRRTLFRDPDVFRAVDVSFAITEPVGRW